MAQLYYRYSTMNAGKSMEVIKVAHNYEERGKRVLALVPGIDDRFGKGMITSRIGPQREATIVNEETNILEIFMRENNRDPIDCVVVDECQFCTEQQIEQLKELSLKVTVLCYGLLTNFKTKLFEGSKRLVELADSLQELKSVCSCGKKANVNARMLNGKLTTNGDTVAIEKQNNITYQPMCYDCYSKLLKMGE